MSSESANLDCPPEKSLEIGSLLDASSWNGYQKLVLLLLTSVMVLDGVDAQVLSLSLSAITTEFHTNRSAISWIYALSFIGMAIGAALGGILGDKYGRKIVLVVATFVFGALTATAAFVDSIFWLGACRAIASLGMGGAMPTVAALTAEYTGAGKRSLALGVVMAGLPLGGILVGVLAAGVLPTQGWRSLFLVAGLAPVVLSIVLLALLPDSLRFVLKKSKNTYKASRILARVTGQKISSNLHLYYQEEKKTKVSISEIATGGYLLDTVLISLGLFFAVLCTYMMYSWSPTFFIEAGYDVKYSSLTMSLFSTGGLLGAIIAGYFFSVLGSRKTLIKMVALGIMFCIGLCVLPSSQISESPTAILIALFVLGVCIPGTQSAIMVMVTQVYPSHMRSTGVGIAAAVGRVGAIASAFIGPYALSGANLTFFGTLALAMLFCILMVCTVSRQVKRVEKFSPVTLKTQEAD
ncbi:MFS transporter [Pseudomonas helleri]|uniref:MFS transporter n=1 Tax=Pseudomonas helleri TaxID=1608996 RepID=A0A6L5HXR9_9PSED|nr:MFS transporter [Pseudomonas helleri]MQU08159.1 MFS transporter [Pseudomonas helleri]